MIFSWLKQRRIDKDLSRGRYFAQEKILEMGFDDAKKYLKDKIEESFCFGQYNHFDKGILDEIDFYERQINHDIYEICG